MPCQIYKNFKMKSILLVILFGVTNFMFAQSKFNGVVIDALTEKPIVGVTVYAYELNKSVVTDENGIFIILNGNANPVQVEISLAEYKTQLVKLSPNSNQVIKLLKNSIELQEVIITGNSNKSKEKVSYSVEIILKDDLFQAGKHSLASNLSIIPGVNNISNGVGVSKPVIRGLSNTNIVFLNNGIKAENFQSSSNHPFISDEFSAKKIEVIKGPVSLIYGSDAVGGVINVIKENPSNVNSIEVNVNNQYHSNTEGFVSNLGIKASGEKWFGGASFTKKTHKDYEDGNRKQIVNSRFEEMNFGSSVGYRSKFGIFALYYDYNLPTFGITNQKSIIAVKDNERKIDFWTAKLENKLLTSKNKFFIGKDFLDVDVAYQQNIRQGISDNTNPNPEMVFASMDLKTISYNSKYTIKGEVNKFTIGFNGAKIENDADDFYKNSNPMPDAKINDLGFFAVNELDFSDNLTLNAGLRYDLRSMKSYPFIGTGLNKYEIDNNYSSFSGSLGSTYKMNDHLFKLNIASGYRSPNISELTQNGIHQARFERGDQNLKAQRNYQLDFNYHFHIDNLVFEVSPFYNKVDNFIYIVQTTENAPIGGGKIWQYLQNDANLYGGEIAIDYHPFLWLGLHSNYTFTKGVLKNGENLTEIPQNRLVAEIKFEKSKMVFLDKPYFILNFTNYQSQENLGQLETYTPGYKLFNIGVGSKINIQKQSFNWYFSVNNLFDKEYIDHLSALKPLNLSNIGRNIVFGVNIPFHAKF